MRPEALGPCPVCYAILNERNGRRLPTHLLHAHRPEDFGLSPLRDGEPEVIR